MYFSGTKSCKVEPQKSVMNPQKPLQFVEIAPHYDLLMRGVPYSMWVHYLQQIFQRFDASPRRILDLACGTGTVSLLLQRTGYEVIGVDISPDMIAVAQEKAHKSRSSARFYCQDACDLDIPEESFQICVSLFDSLNYILEPTRLRQAFQRVSNLVERGGLFIFDLNTEYALATRMFDQTQTSANAPLRYRWRSSFDADTRLCRIEMEFQLHERQGDCNFYEEHWQYAYREDEILSMLKAAGFFPIETYQAYTFLQPGPKSDRVFYVAKRSDENVKDLQEFNDESSK